AGDSRAGGRIAASGEREVLDLVVASDQHDERQIAVDGQLRPGVRLDPAIGIYGSQLDPAVRSPLDLDVRAQADRRVQGGRAFVKDVQRPDVDRAAREIDAGGRGRGELHGLEL